MSELQQDRRDKDHLEELTFEQAFERLEMVVRRLEAGEVSLDQSLALFEEGVALSRRCAALLDAAEGKMRVLLEGDDGDQEVDPGQFSGALSS